MKKSIHCNSVDYFSRRIKINALKKITPRKNNRKDKSMFSRFGVRVRRDNAGCYASEVCKIFSQETNSNMTAVHDLQSLTNLQKKSCKWYTFIKETQRL